MLNEWLSCTPRDPCNYTKFSVVDIQEIAVPSTEIKDYLVDIVRNALYDIRYLAAMARSLGWSGVDKLIVSAGLPTNTSIKRGDFGEAVFTEIMEKQHNYTIPVRKLRYKIVGNRTLPGTDIIAIRVDDNGRIHEVCYVESKLRTANSDKMTAVEGYNQLENDYEQQLPVMLSFIAARLFDQGNPLFKAFASYMSDRADTRDIDTFRVFLCWQEASWDEGILENLESSEISLANVTVHVMIVSNLKTLTDEVFEALGIEEVSDAD